jgi:alpha-ketoglutarate-dependent taurine dioxygenase
MSVKRAPWVVIMTQVQLKSQRAPRDWPFDVKPLHPVLGCEIIGVTLKEALSPKLFAQIYEAFLTYELILFRDIDLPPASQVAFARSFGEVQVHVLSEQYGYKNHPEIYLLSNLDEDGNPSGKHPDKGTLYWHTDGSWRERTGQATMMYSEIVPPAGGETEFADMYSAYELLPAAMKARIEGRRAIHNFDFSRTRSRRTAVNSGTTGKSAADRTSDRTHPSRNRTEGDLPWRSRRKD